MQRWPAQPYPEVIMLRITSSMCASGMTTTSKFDIISADPPNASEKASEEIQKVTGSRKTTAGENKDLPCGFFPVSKIVEQTGTHATTTEFTDAICRELEA